jgi:hypothetical protein
VTDNRGRLYVTARHRAADSAVATLFYTLSLQGELLGSAADLSEQAAEHPVDPMVPGQAGLLWWDESTRSLWYSRRGPKFELLRVDSTGRVLQRIRLRDGTIATAGQRYERSALPGSRVAIRPPPLRGSVQLLPLPGGFIANASVLDDGRVRFDAFRLSDGSFHARWVELDTDHAIAFGDGPSSMVFRISDDPPDLIGYQASLRVTGKP